MSNQTSTRPDGIGSSGGFLGHSNPLSAREVVETCVFPTLLYGAENWILDEELLERFQAEIGRRILKLTRYHSSLAVQIGLSLPSVTSRILKLKLSYRYHLLSSENESIATTTFKVMASQNVYNLLLVRQCIFLDSKLKTAQILNGINCASSCLGVKKKAITSTDHRLMLEEASKHQSVSLASEINWLGSSQGQRSVLDKHRTDLLHQASLRRNILPQSLHSRGYQFL